ncbi:hypothetical protein CVT24_003916, partial [Panaeolus cyanescens]
MSAFAQFVETVVEVSISPPPNVKIKRSTTGTSVVDDSSQPAPDTIRRSKRVKTVSATPVPQPSATSYNEDGGPVGDVTDANRANIKHIAKSVLYYKSAGEHLNTRASGHFGLAPDGCAYFT